MSAVLDVDAFLQMLPDTAVLRTHSESVKTAGAEVESVAGSAGQAWGRLQGGGVYSAPGQETVFSAFAPILTRAGDVSTAASELFLAIKSYADEVDDIRRRFEAEVRPAADALAADTAGEHVTDWDDDGDLVDRHNAIISQINRFVGELDAAQRACARALGRVRSGNKCEPAEPNGDPLGFGLAYGKGAGVVPAGAGPMTPAQLDSAAETPDGLPWGRFVERDYGIHPFAKGVLDQALAPVETYQTFTGKRGPDGHDHRYPRAFLYVGLPNRPEHGRGGEQEADASSDGPGGPVEDGSHAGCRTPDFRSRFPAHTQWRRCEGRLRRPAAGEGRAC
ncbi:hypothetical protein LJ754_01480 [Arthrobacter sp. zg-Y40]|uniref:hypothetical protein n=1 Tax=unclassified Arthrobacter TaxID=235627 RepID=UPI001D1570B5|nr:MULTISPECIES: hypothetical protein [unclassified Arthrobacter]MCC3277834.1 hypothetical protein [Arthrobacter sp. zg-Y40]MDK1327070.1 hypothetical protein [Arthrobacter sp. zg-Y1143]